MGISKFDSSPKNKTICWTCLRARPIPGIGCSWAKDFTPVKGWVAEETEVNTVRKISGVVKTISYGSYRVRQCPLYIDEGNVQTDEFTFEEQMA